MRYLLVLLGFLSACSPYQQEFDCPPGKGIPCTPVTTLEKMIVESPCGPDIMLGCTPKLADKEERRGCISTSNPCADKPFQRRVWIAPKECEGKPFYLYFDEETVCEKP